MYRTEEEYFDWINGLVNPAEKLLAEKVGDFSDLFGDMIFEEGSITNREDNVQPYEDYTDFGFWSIYYKVEQNETDDGSYNTVEHILTVTPDQLEEDHTILHEMIHVYENLLEETSMNRKDMVCWALYKELRKKVPELDSLIDDIVDNLMSECAFDRNGGHGILFLLKSIDLDIKMGYSLGTVFHYGGDDIFGKYGYKPGDLEGE